MTGYGYREQQDEDISFSVEIKGYNSRFLEMTVNLPSQLSALDHEIRRYLAERFRRGKLEINIHLKEHDSPFSVSVNRGAVAAYLEAIKTLTETLGLHEKPSLGLLLGLEGVLEIEKPKEAQAFWDRIEPVLRIAADQFDEDRRREGKHTEADILAHIGMLEDAAGVIASHIPALEASIKENLKTRFMELQKDIDENRILAETAVLLMKYTIAEEVSRLSAHLTEFRAEIERNPGPGKKLDFLCQEINREINTIGSKTPILEVSRAVVAMKDALENIREQLRNVE
ncbi:MAG: YicC family protein [Spirochaetaceae bacterium]|jgi:uncharacterized protein (TIGR00255 family)|nr:YicC family protein [Spirochaetaceae bacterium]